MADDENATRLDDRPQERESPIRHAHAVEAARHGRASAPGYLGLPAEDVAEADAVTEEEDSEQNDPAAERSTRGRAGNARRGSSGGREAAAGKRDRVRTGTGTSESEADRQQQQPTKRTTAAKRATGAKRSSASGASSSGAKKQQQPKAQPSGRTAKPKKTQGGKGPSTARGAKAAASTVKSRVASAGEDLAHDARGRVRKEAFHLGGKLARRALRAGSRAAGRAVSRAGTHGIDRLLERPHWLPIQRSVDIAVPLDVAWEQWMEFKHLPEGVHRVLDVQRDGEELTGRLDGVRQRDWGAVVIDEREGESFAWRSTEGSDSAGLVTFHELADRLTRLELDLDIRPVDLAEATGLLFRLADKRVESEMRRFKADAEFLNPDIYDELLESQRNGSSDGEDVGNNGASEGPTKSHTQEG